MPPLPTHRELLETERMVSPEINRWEPRVAAGGDLLPTPSHYDFARETTFDGTEGYDAGITTQHKTVTTRHEMCVDGDRVAQQQWNSYSVHGLHTEQSGLSDRVWLDDGRFYYWRPGSKRDGVPQGAMQISEDTVQIVDQGTIAWLSSEQTDDGGIMWYTQKWDKEGHHYITETIDANGRLTTAEHYIMNGKDGANFFSGANISWRTDYSYSPNGNLTKEVRTLTWHSEDNEREQVETTIFRYLPNGVVSHVTKLGDGSEIRRGTRHYDEEGRFLRAEVTENIPGEGRVRKVAQRAISYAWINEELRPSIW